jgi:1-acyl-sn-glycerol-3-phosphate acyltransferase
MKAEIDYSTLDYSSFSFPERLIRIILKLLLLVLVRIHVDGLENVPRSGSLIVAINHLHIIDVVLAGCIVPRRSVVLAKGKWQRSAFTRWLLTFGGNAIFIEDTNAHAYHQALAVLNAGGVLGIAPEGTRSLTGGLGQGLPGMAKLATQADVPILPMIMYGQEQSGKYWRRFRRVPIEVRIGPQVALPPGRPTKEQLLIYTDYIMTVLASMLPRKYRGVYTESALVSGVSKQLSMR